MGDQRPSRAVGQQFRSVALLQRASIGDDPVDRKQKQITVATAGWLTSKAVPPSDPDGAFAGQEFARLPRPGTYYMGLNTKGEHTNNVHFRKALSLHPADHLAKEGLARVTEKN